MNPAQHTKGPWTLRAWTSEYGLDYFVDAKSGITAVARVLSAHISGNPETQANARLIAAAPELLRVAEMLADVSDTKLGHMIYTEQLVNLVRDLRMEARAAIAKAKGGAS